VLFTSVDDAVLERQGPLRRKRLGVQGGPERAPADRVRDR